MVAASVFAKWLDYDRDGLNAIYGAIAKIKCMALSIRASFLKKKGWNGLSYEKKYNRYCNPAWIG